MFYSIGKTTPFIYELRSELFRFSHENVNTGVDVVDQTAKHVEYTIKLNVGSGSGNFNIGETVFQGANLEFATASAEVKDWDPIGDIILLINIVGEFSTTGTITGALSGTTYTINDKDIINDFIDYDLYNNGHFKDEANNYIDLSQNNPFGLPT